MFTLTFKKVFGPNTKEGAKWTRWDYKTSDDTRFVHFNSTQDIPLNVPVRVELRNDNEITSWSVSEENQQAGNPSQNGSQAVRSDSVASQTPSGSQDGRDFRAEAEGKTRCALVAQLLPAMFTALDQEDQTPEGAQVLLDWAFAYVFQIDSVPF